MTLFSKTVAERTRPGQRQDVEEQGIQATPKMHQNNPPNPPTSLHIPRLRPHRRRRRDNHQRPRLPRPRSPPTPLQSRRRVPVPLPSDRLLLAEPAAPLVPAP